MTLALTLKLKDNDEPLPSALIPFCPYTDAGDCFASRTERDAIDPMVPGTVGKDTRRHYLDGADPKDPYVSVRYGNFEGFPKTFICVGTDEVLYDDSVDLHKQLDRCGVENKLSIYQDLYHAFSMLPSPEADEALEEAVSYILGA